MSSEISVPYFAGIIDTLGRIRLMTTPGGTDLPLLAISSPNPSLMKLLADVTGVKAIHTHRTYDKHRCADHCLTKHEHIVSTSGRWQVTGAKATIVLAAVQPYLQVQVTEVEEALRVGLRATRKSKTVQKMLDLGWPEPDWIEE